MKNGLVTLLLFMTSITCYAQGKIRRGSEIMLDVGAAVMSWTMKIHISHAISDHWTIEAGAGLCLANAARTKTEDERRHEEEGFQDTASNKIRTCTDMNIGEIQAVYWPSKTYEGILLMVGCSVGNHSGTDMSIGAGYSIKIWRGLAVRLFSNMKTIASCKAGRAEGELVTLGISYKF